MRRRRLRVKSAGLESHANRRDVGRRRARRTRAAAVETLVEEGELAVAETPALARALAEDEAGIEHGRFRFSARREDAVGADEDRVSAWTAEVVSRPGGGRNGVQVQALRPQ